MDGMMDNSSYEKKPIYRSWKDLDGNIVVEWDGVLLVYPDFYGGNDARVEDISTKQNGGKTLK